MAKEPVFTSTRISAVDQNGDESRIVVDTSFDPPRLIVELPDGATRDLGVVTVDGTVALVTPNDDSAMDDANDAVRVNVVAGSAAGTEYTEGDTDATFDGVIAMAEGPSDTATPIQVDASKHLQVDIAADSVGVGGGTQYTEDVAAAADPVGNSQILVRLDTPAAITDTDGDNVARRGTNYGAAYSQIVDSSGNYVDSFGGGTQYTENATDASITGTVAMMEVAGDAIEPVQGTVADGLLVNLGTNNDVTVTSGTVTAVTDITNPVAVTGTFWQATQPISGTVTADVADVTAGPTALGALNAAESIALAGRSGAGMFLAAGTLIGTIVPECSVDGGTTWVSTFFSDPITDAKINAITYASANTATTRTIVVSGGVSHVRIRVSIYTSGTANVTLRATTAKELSPPFASQNTQNVPTSAVLIAGSDGTLLRNARATNTTPGGSEYALITRPIPSGTQAVSAASLPLPAGAATSALQLPDGHNVTVDNAGAGAAVNIQDGGNSITVDGTFWQATQPVSGTFWQATQPISAAALPLPSGAATSALQLPDGHNVTIDNASGASAVNIQDGGNAITVDQGTASSLNAQIVGEVAHDGADAGGNPVKVGGYATNAERTAVANADRADLVTDLVGKLINLPYANPENFLMGDSSATTTADTAVIAAQAAGVRIYVTSIQVANSSSTDDLVAIKDGATTILTTAAPANGGSNIHFPVPLRLTAATALNMAAITGVTTMYFNAQGYKGV